MSRAAEDPSTQKKVLVVRYLQLGGGLRVNVRAVPNETGADEQMCHILRERSRQAWATKRKGNYSIIILSFEEDEDRHTTNWNLHSLSARLRVEIPQFERPDEGDRFLLINYFYGKFKVDTRRIGERVKLSCTLIVKRPHC